jgi:subtilisin family serine protease
MKTLIQHCGDYIDSDFVPAPITPEPANKIEGHGMAVLGIIAAKHNNPVPIGNDGSSFGYQSVAGGSPNVRIIPLRIFDEDGVGALESQVASSIYYASAAGADVINCSWGYPNPPDVVVKAIDTAALTGRGGKGCVIVASSGNYGQNFMGYPAKSPYAIAVGAVKANDELWYYSSFGNALDVVAPSGSPCIGKEADGQCAQDPTNYFFTIDRMDGWGYNNKQFGSCIPTQDKDYTCTFGGTSGAAPNVSSEVALLLSIDSTLTRAQVVDIVRKSAHKALAWGTMQPHDSIQYGQGRANAVRALSSVRRGDCNASGTINITDITYLNAYFFSGGPAPFPDRYFGDANCDGSVNVVDITRLVNYLFQGGPPITKPCTAFLLD